MIASKGLKLGIEVPQKWHTTYILPKNEGLSLKLFDIKYKQKEMYCTLFNYVRKAAQAI